MWNISKYKLGWLVLRYVVTYIMYVHTCIYICTYIVMYMHFYACTYVCVYYVDINTYIQTYAICTYVYMNSCISFYCRRISSTTTRNTARITHSEWCVLTVSSLWFCYHVIIVIMWSSIHIVVTINYIQMCM